MRFLGVFALCFILAGAHAAAAETHDFRTWLGNLRSEARIKGISDATIKAALPDTLQPIEKIIRLDRKQPEKTRTMAEYLTDVVNGKRQSDGKIQYRDNALLLSETGQKYGVDPQFIVALWGIETNFGKNTGGYDVVTALATLAWDGRRGEYFRGELLNALKIIDEGHISAENMKGSWAGAMGQTQFMPSSFFNFAEDYNRNGRRDIWNEREDIFASAANYLARSGWIYGQPWGRKVRLPDNFKSSYIGLDIDRPVTFWREKGVMLPSGAPLSDDGATKAAVIQPDGPGTQAYIVYNNYRVIMKWNKSTYFATAVGLLADAVGG